VSPVKYELGFYIPAEAILHSVLVCSASRYSAPTAGSDMALSAGVNEIFVINCMRSMETDLSQINVGNENCFSCQTSCEWQLRCDECPHYSAQRTPDSSIGANLASTTACCLPGRMIASAAGIQALLVLHSTDKQFRSVLHHGQALSTSAFAYFTRITSILISAKLSPP
jgi:hypothetical protein